MLFISLQRSTPNRNMNITEKYLEEVPNLSYIMALAKTDLDFKQKFITTLKEEFAIDSIAYMYHIEIDEPRAASEIVNKLKYTFSFLSMKETYAFAESYQEKLRTGNTNLNARFKKVLVTVHKFLSDI